MSGRVAARPRVSAPVLHDPKMLFLLARRCRQRLQAGMSVEMTCSR